MKQTISTIVFVFIIIVLLAAIVYGSSNKNDSSSLLFFYGNTCPHCKDVELWMEKNNVEKKLDIRKKEVYDNKANALELEREAKQCGLSTDSIGVPFLYTPEGTCIMGTPQIINYLQEQL